MGDSVLPETPFDMQVRAITLGLAPLIPLWLLIFYTPGGREVKTAIMGVYGVMLFAAMGVVLWRWREELDSWLRC